MSCSRTSVEAAACAVRRPLERLGAPAVLLGPLRPRALRLLGLAPQLVRARGALAPPSPRRRWMRSSISLRWVMRLSSSLRADSPRSLPAATLMRRPISSADAASARCLATPARRRAAARAPRAPRGPPARGPPRRGCSPPRAPAPVRVGELRLLARPPSASRSRTRARSSLALCRSFSWLARFSSSACWFFASPLRTLLRLPHLLLQRVVPGEDLVVALLHAGHLAGQLGDLALLLQGAHGRALALTAGEGAVRAHHLALQRDQRARAGPPPPRRPAPRPCPGR